MREMFKLDWFAKVGYQKTVGMNFIRAVHCRCVGGRRYELISHVAVGDGRRGGWSDGVGRWSRLGLADVACAAVVAVRVVPAPAEDPQHLRAVLVRVGVVGLVHVPVGVRRRPCVADVADPVPRRRRTVDAASTSHQADPQVTVTRAPGRLDLAPGRPTGHSDACLHATSMYLLCIGTHSSLQ